MSRELEIAGQKFGRLTAIKKTGKKRYPKGCVVNTWLCRCECGDETVVIAQSLRSGHTKSCGCLYRETRGKASKPKPGGAKRLAYGSYRSGAEKRLLAFNLTHDDFVNLATKPCHYCGTSSSNRFVTKAGDEFLYNGVDRKDNSQGYTKENCVPCCRTCNWMKGKMSEAEFVTHCRKVSSMLEVMGLG